MWPFDRKKKREEAERIAAAQREAKLAELRAVAETRRTTVERVNRSPAFGHSYGTSRNTPADDTLLYASAAHSFHSPSSDSHHCSSSDSGSSYSSSDSGSSDSGGSCGGSD